MSPLLESIFTGVAYDIIKGTLKELFKDDTEELTKRLYKAVDVAMERFDDQYGARFGKAANSFLGRDDNLKLIARSLHFSQPPLASAAFDPRGFDGAPDATEQEISCFLSLLDAEIRNDLFLDKHFREKQQMGATAEVRRDLAEVLDLIRNGVPGFTPSSEAVEDPWESAKIIDLEHPEGWQPEQGQIYTTQSANAAVVRYMLHGPLLGVEYTHPEGWSLYVDVASDGTTHNLRLPHPLSEYSIVIPDDLVVKR